MVTPIDREKGYLIVGVTTSIVLATSQFGDIWRSTDAGRNWTRVNDGLGSYPFLWDGSFSERVRGDGSSARTGSHSTADGGATWKLRANGVGEQMYDIDMRTESFGLAVGEDGYVNRTTDGGRTWTPSRLKVTGDYNSSVTRTLRAVSFLDDDFCGDGRLRRNRLQDGGRRAPRGHRSATRHCRIPTASTTSSSRRVRTAG